MNKLPIIVLLILFGIESQSLAQTSDDRNSFEYSLAADSLEKMLQGEGKLDFSRAVFLTEQAYLAEPITYERFQSEIHLLAFLAEKTFQQQISSLAYDYSDKNRIGRYAAVFSVMMDTLEVQHNDTIWALPPFHYDFEDVFGDRDWSQMFISKLLATRRGNCHSLPYLYKILCEELGVRAHLALAPNHVYIKHYAEKTGWYNTELTSATFPVDAWLMASGYISLPAIQNGIYLDTLSEQESIALCVVDLAQGYAHKHPNHDGSFVLRCCKLALQYFPDCIPALLLQADTYAKQFQALAQQNPESPSPETTQAFEKMNQAYAHIHQLGYRQMPKEMYADWLLSLQMEKEKYVNPNVATFKQGGK